MKVRFRPDDGTGGGNTAPQPPAPPAGAPDPPAPGSGGTPGGSGRSQTGDEWPEKAREALSKANQEAKEAREARQALEKRLKELEDAQLSEHERTAKERDQLKADLERSSGSIREAWLVAEIAKLASDDEIRIVDQDAARKLLDDSEIDWTDDGRPKNVQKLLTALVKARPWLQGGAAQAYDAGGASRGGRRRAGEGLPTRDELAAMTPEQITRQFTEQQVLDALAAP